MSMVRRLREKPAHILFPTMLAFCLQRLIALTYWELHTSHHVTLQANCYVAVDESNCNQLASIVGKGGHTPPLSRSTPPFSKIPSFLEMQDLPTFYGPIRKKVLNNSFDQFVYKVYSQNHKMS